MPPVIRIDNDVFKALQARAEPLVDTPNSVLRRLLQVDAVAATAPAARVEERDSKPPRLPSRPKAPSAKVKRAKPRKTADKSDRAPRGSLLPEEQYESAILRYLARTGGAATAKDVAAAVEEALGSRFSALERTKLRSGGVRWHSRLHFVRLHLVSRGLLANGSPRGTWELTQQGPQTTGEVTAA